MAGQTLLAAAVFRETAQERICIVLMLPLEVEVLQGGWFCKVRKVQLVTTYPQHTSRGLVVALMAVGKVGGCEGPVVSEEVR